MPLPYRSGILYEPLIRAVFRDLTGVPPCCTGWYRIDDDEFSQVILEHMYSAGLRLFVEFERKKDDPTNPTVTSDPWVGDLVYS